MLRLHTLKYNTYEIFKRNKKKIEAPSMFYDGLPLEYFPTLIHRYNAFNRQLKGLYCLIFTFNLNITASSLLRYSILYLLSNTFQSKIRNLSNT